MKAFWMIITAAVFLLIVHACDVDAGGLNLTASRCDILSNYKPVDDFSEIKPGVKILAPWSGNRTMTAVSGVFMWKKADYRPTIKAKHDGAKMPMFVFADEARYCIPK